ncbi:MAG: 23S rRNA (adenine(2030)-N(6))-methyltransferase RlmJ [Gammaproteobacteria bacterium]|nr:23S rRNA (adenine(2030)-N(6))-methyltransferase RlmJ [Gammaproteobacteria bacterium]
MLSYRHAYHAGNIADLLKHWVLVSVLRYMGEKAKPYLYLDTHAGAGSYLLDSPQAQLNREFQQGIAQLWQADDLPDSLNQYVDVVRGFNQQRGETALTHYPGSPIIARSLMRFTPELHDRLTLYERHPQEVLLLQQAFNRERHIQVIAGDGFAGLQAALPPPERRAVILIDPPYELKSEPKQVIESLQQAYRRFATGCYLVWYPVIERQSVHWLERRMQNSGIKNIALFELCVAPDSPGHGMSGSGMLVVNPPWKLLADLSANLPYLAAKLAGSSGSYRAQTLVAA